MDGSSIVSRLASVKQKIAHSEEKAGRASGSARLLAVSKEQPVSKIQAAFEAGQVDFAENYAQEAVQKISELENLPVAWHFIGRIQSNKVKMLAGKFAYIHSVDRVEIAAAFDSVSVDRPQKVFAQYNVAGEERKGGAGDAELQALVEKIVGFKNLRLQGLMVMPPMTEDAEANRPLFHRAKRMLWELRSRLSPAERTFHPLDQLSMGTSQDFAVAVEEGATWVRVGSDVFGPREGHK